jgi:hypothetical protein
MPHISVVLNLLLLSYVQLLVKFVGRFKNGDEKKWNEKALETGIYIYSLHFGVNLAGSEKVGKEEGWKKTQWKKTRWKSILGSREWQECSG